MIKNLLLISILFFPLTSCTAADSNRQTASETASTVKLWGKSRFGQPVAEVKKAYPSAYQLDTPEDFVDSFGLLKLKHVKVSKDYFDVIFIFNKDTNTLDSVLLDPEESNSQELNRLFDELQVLLSEKYGRVVSQSDQIHGPILSRSLAWIDNHLRINLSTTALFDEQSKTFTLALVKVKYSKIDPANTANL